MQGSFGPRYFAHDYDLVLLDMKMSDGNESMCCGGERIKAKRPICESLIVTGYASVDTAVEEIQKAPATTCRNRFNSG